MMPDELGCPTPGVDDPVVIIDAIYDLRLSYLIDLTERHRGFPLGFERFLEWAERKAGLSGDRLDAASGFLVLPSCELVSRKLFKKAMHGSISVSTYILTFADGDRFFEVEMRTRAGLLTKLHLDPTSMIYKIVEHYPNAYRFIRINPMFPWKVLNLPLKGLDPDRRIGFQSHGDSVELRNVETSASNK